MLLTDIPLPVTILLTVQGGLLVVFSFFAFFNYLYGIASLFRPLLKRVQPSASKVAVVIVAFNERHVLQATVEACERLTYANKLIVLADDSSDSEVIASVRQIAQSHGCRRDVFDPCFADASSASLGSESASVELWESPAFVLLHRSDNVGFKAGSLNTVMKYLEDRAVDYMYLLDADWHPQPDVLERTLSVLEGNPNAAFVQTKRVANLQGMSLFQKYVSLVEEGCYHVDFEGRQVLQHPVLFSGCCALFRLAAVRKVGGFTAGHLTEDLDLTDRLWLAGLRGIYDGTVVNHGEVPFSYDDYRRQQQRWAAGSARALRHFFWPIVCTRRVGWLQKLSMIRQNAYFTTALLTTCAIVVGMGTVLWLTFAWNTYAVELYLYILGYVKVPFLALLYWCILSNFVEPVLMIVVKTRRFRDLFHLPMMVWYAWSVLLTYVAGNIAGLSGRQLNWFRTPKYLRTDVPNLANTSMVLRAANFLSCLAFLALYTSEGWIFGWFDEFALLLLPAFVLASVR